MATSDQIPTDLTLEIGVDLTPEAFLAASRHFFGLIKEISTDSCEDAIGWRVRVKEGSNLIALEPDQLVAAASVEAVYEKFSKGTRLLMAGDIDAAELSDAALSHFRHLSQLTASKKQPTPMKFWVKKKPMPIGPKIAEIIREDWRTEYSDVGTIEGRLQAIQESGTSLKIKIKDPLYSKAIECALPENMIEEALATFRKRVEISGIIRYRKNGLPVSIQVEEIEVLPDDDSLPTAEDVRGILAAS